VDPGFCRAVSMMSAKTIFVLTLVLSAVGGLTAQDVDANRAKTIYEAAIHETDPQQQLNLFRASFEAKQSFEASIAIAESLIAQESAPLEARQWSERAYGLAPAGAARARALFRLAETYAATNQALEYRALLKRSIEELPSPEAEKALLEAPRGPVIAANDIVRSWRVGSERSLRDLRLEPTVDLAVNFEFDSADVDRAGDAQLNELAAAIGLVSYGQPPGRTQRIAVIGHTDTQGSDEYNMALSRRRAEAVKALLVGRYGLHADDIKTEGRGMREPLVHGNTPQHHSVNRRVEVKLLP